MESVATINQRAVYKYNHIVSIGAGGDKVYSFTVSSGQAWRFVWLFASHNMLRGEMNWQVQVANLKMDDVAVAPGDNYIGIGDFYNVLTQLYGGMGVIPLEVYRKVFFNVKITNNDIVPVDSDLTLWFIFLHNDHGAINVEVSVA